MNGFFKIFISFGQRVGQSILGSSDSIHKISMGAAYGIFWGMTPTVGLQISILVACTSCIIILNRWTRGALKTIEFNLPLAIALTWVSNPLNAPFLYFAFYWLGVQVLPGITLLSSDEFLAIFNPILEAETMGARWDTLMAIFKDMGCQIIYPLILGSVALAVPSSFLSYFSFRVFLTRRKNKSSRSKKALKKA